jgi:hypothetical protein
MDLSNLFGGGNDVGGLLTPQQSSDINQTTLMNIAAGLMKAGGPSPYKAGMTTLSGLGEALQGGLAARQSAQHEALVQTLTRAKTLESMAPLLRMRQESAEAGIPLDPNIQRVLDTLGTITGMARPPGQAYAQAPGQAYAQAPGQAAPPPSSAPVKVEQSQSALWNAIPDVPPPGNALPATDIRQKFADWKGFNRSAIIKDRSGNAEFQKAFDDWAKTASPEQDAADQRKELIKQETEAYGKQYAAYQAMGRTSAGLYDLGEQAKAIMSRPDFQNTTGFGADTKIEARRLLASLGVANPDAAFSGESFNKIFSEALQSRIEAAKEQSAELGSAGKQYLAQLQIMAKASPSVNNSLATNQYLVDQMQREAQRHMGIAKAATAYAQNNPSGRLDKGWDTKMIDLLAKPTYSREELGNMTTGQRLPGSSAPIAGDAAGTQPIPGMMSPRGPGAGSTFAPMPPGAPPTPAGAQAAPQVIRKTGIDAKGNRVEFVLVNGKWERASGR